MIRAAGAQPGGEWRFSVLDRACLNMVIKGMWLFHGRLDAAAMKESFARLLGYYPHLCGRVMRGEAVACDNSGVPLRWMKHRVAGWSRQCSCRMLRNVSGHISTCRVSNGEGRRR